MIETLLASSKIKAIIAALSLLILGCGIYECSTGQHLNIEITPNQNQNIDPYITEIQQRADSVNNAVYEVKLQQGKQEAWQYQQTVESTIIYIQNKDLEAQEERLPLSPDEKTLNDDYQKYLHEAFVVVADYYNGKTPDMSKMQDYRDQFNKTSFKKESIN